jgi:hypothetical protein
MTESRPSRVYPHLRDFKHLVIGRRYRVAKAFIDFDRGKHPIGEEWTFEGHSFLPYDDGLSLFVSKEEGDVTHIRMRWTDEDQGPVVDALETYVREAR